MNPPQYHQPMSPPQAIAPSAQPPLLHQNPNPVQMLSQQFVPVNVSDQMIRDLQMAHTHFTSSVNLLTHGIQLLYKYLH